MSSNLRLECRTRGALQNPLACSQNNLCDRENTHPMLGLFNKQPLVATGQELQNDVVLANGPEDLVLDIAFLSQLNHLLVALWDGKVRIYEIDQLLGQNQGRAMFEHTGPVLSARWSNDGTKVALGATDKTVKLFDVQSQQAQQIGVHDAPVRSIRFVECGPTNTPVVVLGSWDKTLKYWDMRLPQPVATVALPERVYLMDSVAKLLVVGCAERQICIFDLNNPQQIFKTKELPLKMQTRVISCYPQANGYAVGLIEGRCAIQYVNDAEQSKLGFSFKCHRVQKSNNLLGGPTLEAYPVNLIVFHPTFSTFATAGLDGVFTFWDKDVKQRLKGFPSVGGTISSTAFNRDGLIFAYAISYDWLKGFEYNKPDTPNVIKLHATKDDEVKPKNKR